MGATNDPAGEGLWVIGECSRANASATPAWGSYIGEFAIGCEAFTDRLFSNGFESPRARA